VCSLSACRTAVLSRRSAPPGRRLITGTHHRWHPATRRSGAGLAQRRPAGLPERVWERMRRCRLAVTGSPCSAVCTSRRSASSCGRLSAGCARRRFRRGDGQTLPGDVAKEMQRRSSRQIRTRVGVSGQALRGDGYPIRASDWMRARFSAWAASSWRDILVEEGDGIVVPVLHPLAISRMGPVAA
jgi:hypothetical protein